MNLQGGLGAKTDSDATLTQTLSHPNTKDFRSRLMKDLAGWERQQRQSFVSYSLPSAPSTSTAGSATEVLTGEAKTTQWGIVTEYVRPLSGPSYFQGPDGNIHCGSEGFYYYRRMPRSPHLCWDFIACRYCRRFAVTFPDNGGINYT